MIKVIAFEGSSNVGKTTLIKAYAKKLQNEGNLVFIHKPTGDESTYGKEYDIFSFEGLDKDYAKPYQERYQKARENVADSIDYLLSKDANLNDVDKHAAIHVICRCKIEQLHVVRMLLNNIVTDKDIYLLVDRTMISSLIYGYSYNGNGNLESLIVNKQYQSVLGVKNMIDVFVNVTRNEPFNLPEAKQNGAEFDKTFDHESMSKHNQYQKLYSDFFDVAIGNHKVVTIDVGDEEPDVLASELDGMVDKVDVSGMDWYEFMQLANSTNSTYNGDISKSLFHGLVGILGEVNEVYDTETTQTIVSNEPLTFEQKQCMLSEMGDVLWYCAIALHDLDRVITDKFSSSKGLNIVDSINYKYCKALIVDYIAFDKLNTVYKLTFNDENRDNFLMGLFQNRLSRTASVIDDFKKHYFYGQPLSDVLINDFFMLVQDVVSTVNTAAFEYGMDLESVANSVIKKLKARYPNKFSVEDSINRDYTKESQASGLLGK